MLVHHFVWLNKRSEQPAKKCIYIWKREKKNLFVLLFLFWKTETTTATEKNNSHNANEIAMINYIARWPILWNWCCVYVCAKTAIICHMFCTQLDIFRTKGNIQKLTIQFANKQNPNRKQPIHTKPEFENEFICNGETCRTCISIYCHLWHIICLVSDQNTVISKFVSLLLPHRIYSIHFLIEKKTVCVWPPTAT